MSHNARSLPSERELRDGSTALVDRPVASGLAALVALGLCVTTTLLVLLGGVARADAPRLVPDGSFSSVTALPMGIAVDQPSGDIYVAGFFNQSLRPLDKFDVAGNPVSPPSPFGIGETFHGGAAVNPTNGQLYVVNAAGEEIETYDPSSGALLSSFPVAGFGGLSGVLARGIELATDSAGNVYMPDPPNNEVLEYSSTGTLLQTFTGSGAGALKEPAGVAVDSDGNVWVADAGNGRIEELSPADAVIDEIKSEGVEAIALDGHGDVLATVYNSVDSCGALESPCSHLVEYGPDGVQVADVGAGFFESSTSFRGVPVMVAVNESSGRVYVSDFDQESVLVFGPPSAPVVDKQFASEVGTSEVRLGALVNPGGAATTYRFEYDTREYGEGEGPHGQTTPFPEGSVGEGITSRTVWAAASGLAPGTTYHYRIVATNAVGTTTGPDQTFTTEAAAQAACPNEPFRGGFSARLPDCRAYELVTPPTKNSVQFDKKGVIREAAPDGNRMSFSTVEPLPGAPAGGSSYLAIRGEDGWVSEGISPLQSYTAVLCSRYIGGGTLFSRDMTKAVVVVGERDRASEEGTDEGTCGGEAVQVVNGEPLGYENLLLRGNADSYQLINVLPPGVTPADAHLHGVSADLSHVVFGELAQLTPNAPAGVEDLYEWDEGALHLVTVLPDGTPVAGSLVGQQEGLESDPHAVSADGSHIFFMAGGDLYVRLNGSSTVQIDASQAGGVGGGGTFLAASADGSRVLFSDEASAALTRDTVPGSGQNLYEYDVENGALIDLTPVAKVDLRKVVAVSEDNSYAYFLAEGNLAPGAAEGQMNLYVSHGGTIKLIATLAEGQFGKAQASSDGTWLAFTTSKSLTGYDNVEPSGQAVAQELFLYSVASAEIACASCDPSGEPPIVHGGSGELGGEFSISAGGRLFFDSSEALVPSDTNAQRDVYEYEAGALHLISGGTSSTESQLITATESGDDVFFLTAQQLLPQDTEEEGSVIYDARMDGGFPVVASPPPCTTADACRTTVSPQPSIYGAPSSQTFSGAGNVAAPGASKPVIKPKSKSAKCKRGFVKRKGRCIKKHKQKTKRFAHSNKAGK